jgi:TPR repeat protein
MKRTPFRLALWICVSTLTLASGPGCLVPTQSSSSADPGPQSATAAHEDELRAAQGDAEAQFRMGLALDEGVDVPVDRARAAWWYQLAAEQDHALAQNNL